MCMAVDAMESASVASALRRSLPAGLVAVILVGLAVWLGLWQLSRAQDKRARQTACDAAAALPALDLAAAPDGIAVCRRVRVIGRFDAPHQIYLDNRIYQGRPGYQAVAPLLYPGGVVLVNRGWLPASGDHAVTPRAKVPAGPLILEGLVVPARARYLELSRRDVAGPVWENLDLARLRAWYGGGLPDRLVLQTSPADDGLVRDWPRPDTGVQRHLGYAGQWFALAVLITVLYVYHGLWRPAYAPR